MNFCYSVIIPFYGEIKILDIVLDSLKNTGYLNKEIIVVNDNPVCNLSLVTEKYGCNLVDLKRRSGPSFARNVGAKTAKYDYLVFLDADVIVPKDCFAKMNDFLNNNRKVSVANCLVSAYCPYINFISQYTNMIFRYSIVKESKNTVFTSFCVINKVSFWDVGGFEEVVSLPFSDDIVLGWKLYDQKYKFNLIDGLEVTHYKKMRLAKFILWRFLHGYFYGKFYIIYRRRIKFMKSGLKKESIIFLFLFFLIMVSSKELQFFHAVGIGFVCFLLTHFKWIKFFFREKGLLFVLESMPFTLAQYIVYFLGVVCGMVKGFSLTKTYEISSSG